MNLPKELLQLLKGITQAHERGKKLCDLSAEENAEIATLQSKAEGLVKERNKLELVEREIKLDRDKWARVQDKYKISGNLTNDNGSIYELKDVD